MPLLGARVVGKGWGSATNVSSVRLVHTQTSFAQVSRDAFGLLVDASEASLTTLHAGLPWWATIFAVCLGARTAILPLKLWTHLHSKESFRITQERGLRPYSKEWFGLMREQKRGPFVGLLPMFIYLPIFFGVGGALRKMSGLGTLFGGESVSTVDTPASRRSPVNELVAEGGVLSAAGDLGQCGAVDADDVLVDSGFISAPVPGWTQEGIWPLTDLSAVSPTLSISIGLLNILILKHALGITTRGSLAKKPLIIKAIWWSMMGINAVVSVGVLAFLPVSVNLWCGFGAVLGWAEARLLKRLAAACSSQLRTV